jgi:hypothetical protein
MATIVVHRPSGHRYVLIGSGYGAWATSTPGVFFGNLAPREQGNQATLIAVTGVNGEIGWVPSNELLVVSVDGKTPQQILEASGPYR